MFVLFDTSDYMYRGFVFAQDAITDFIRSLGNADKIAFYSYSRDISRAAALNFRPVAGFASRALDCGRRSGRALQRALADAERRGAEYGAGKSWWYSPTVQTIPA